MFEGSFKGVSRVFQGSFKGVSRNIKECSVVPLRKIQVYIKEVQRLFQGSFKGVLRKFHEYKINIKKMVFLSILFSPYQSKIFTNSF